MKPKGIGCGALLALGILAGCSGSGGDDAPGRTTLSVSLMDAPVDGVTAVHVRITSMWIKKAGGPAVQLALVNTPIDVDLLRLTDSNAAILVNEAVIEPGTYEWIAMDIAAERGVRDSYVMTETGREEEIELRVPSGRVRLVSGFEVAPNQAVQLLFDWDMRQGLVNPPGQGQYFLKPAFRMLDVTEYGVLQGTIAGGTVGTSTNPGTNPCVLDSPDVDEGNIVYVFANVATPDDVGSATEPLATVTATRNQIGDYVYRTLLEPGIYTVAFTCQGASDDPEADDDIAFSTAVPVSSDGDVTTVNF